MKKRLIASFEEMVIPNTMAIRGGAQYIIENTAANSTYPKGDHIEWTPDKGKCGEDVKDGWGGGTCPLVVADPNMPPVV